MRKMIILSVISGVISLYFIVDARKVIEFKGRGTEIKQNGGEVTPLGTDIIKFSTENFPGIVQKVQESSRNLLSQDSSVIVGTSSTTAPAPESKIEPIKEQVKEQVLEKTAELVSKTKEKLINLVTESVEQKINETFCEKQP